MASGNGLSLVCVEFESKKIFLSKKLCKEMQRNHLPFVQAQFVFV